MRVRDTTLLRCHFRLAGITYHGAWSVTDSEMAASKARLETFLLLVLGDVEEYFADPRSLLAEHPFELADVPESL